MWYKGCVLAPYDAWKQSKFTAEQLAQLGVGGVLDDSDRVGIYNVFECALGLNPNQASNTGLSVGDVSGGYLTFSFNREKPPRILPIGSR